MTRNSTEHIVKRTSVFLALFLISFFLVAPSTEATAAEKTFTLDTELDESDAVPGDGQCLTAAGACSLRAAIEEANALTTDTYTVYLGSRTICVPSALNIGSNVVLTLSGEGASSTVLDGGNSSASHTSACTVSNSGQIVYAGGISLTINQIKIAGANNTTTNGGALYVESSSSLIVTNSKFFANTAAYSGYDGGGAIYLNGRNSSLQISDSVFSNNSAGWGGAIAVNGYDDSSSASIINSQFSTNSASGSGGAVSVSNMGSFILENSLLEENRSGSYGGALSSNQNTVAAVGNSTFTGNTGYHGGTLSSYSDTSFSLFASTLSANSGTNGNGVYARLSTVKMKSNILADGENECALTDSTLHSYGFNLTQNSDHDCAFSYATSRASASTDLTGQDPLLGTLADHGGPTETIALQEGSPAINQGSCRNILGETSSTDQRGVARDASCDIGAYEYGVDETGLCADNSDNDSDGTVDCSDSDCASSEVCVPSNDEAAASDSGTTGDGDSSSGNSSGSTGGEEASGNSSEGDSPASAESEEPADDDSGDDDSDDDASPDDDPTPEESPEPEGNPASESGAGGCSLVRSAYFH